MGNTKGTSVIASPQGGGAQSGLGEKFSPDLFTGTGNFSVPIAVPPGRNGFQPELSLGYSSGNGNGPFGMGWALGIPGITRKTSKGIPVYSDTTDVFILSGAEDLVPVSLEKTVLPGNIGYETTTYRPRTEGLFARIVRHKKTNGEHYWEVRSKDGLVSWYGTPGAAAGDPAVIANPGNRNSIFSWHLTKTEDPFGNEILYSYTRELVVKPGGRSYDQLYLSGIQYCQYPDGAGIRYLCELRFTYENRPDPFSSYKQGFETRMTKRCTSIESYVHAPLNTRVKTYHFHYPTRLPLNGATLLQSVSVEGHKDGEQEYMPPLEFSYAGFDPAKRNLRDIKGPLPAVMLSEPGYELVDITGNGLPDLLQLGGSARFWTNKGHGEFSQPRALNIAPGLSQTFSLKAEGSGLKGLAFIDANGDGRADLMVVNQATAGYFPGAFQQVWDEQSFRPYRQAPSFNLDDPEVQLIDLDGDGITDVLRNGSKFECFYNDPVNGFSRVRTTEKQITDFSFSDPRIRFADMTGDGLQDIVLISPGRVQYWPNLGYGRFGAKVNMSNAPRFPEHYTPAQVLLGDLDGDGQADIAFVENNSVTLYVNQSGNAFSEGIRIANTPAVRDPKAIRLADILGTGQAGILWTLGGSSATNMIFLDLTGGNKPYVLEQMNNNMGSLTRVKYGSSVYHYLRDQSKPLTRWKTELPFPVQVVDKVEVLDLLSGGKLVTEYQYHNGYWDGVEREFRGFAQVDSLDTESFERYSTQDLFKTEHVATVTAEFYSPPTLTKSWFYVGPVGDGFGRWKEPDFSAEYWSGDTTLLERPQAMTDLLSALPRRARRDALRTLRGSLLRSELYARDQSKLQDRPYTVTESRMSLRLEYPDAPSAITFGSPAGSVAANNILRSQHPSNAVFFPFTISQRTTHYERGTEPLHTFSFTRDYDAYGQAQGQLSVGVPRGAHPLSGGNGNYLATYNVTDYIYKDMNSGPYMVNRVKRSLSHDATQSAIGKTVFALRDAVFGSQTGLPVTGCTVNFYDGLAFAGLPYGQLGSFGAQVRSETLVLTDAILTDAYGANTPECFKPSPDWSTDYPAAFAGLLQHGDTRLGYKDRRTGHPGHIAGWYAESARLQYDFQVGGTSYGLVLESKDTFDSLSTIAYDTYNLLPVSSRQWLNGTDYLETTAEYDYRVMQPYQVKDVNNNCSAFDFSPLGLLRATARIGKGTEGDYKGGAGTGFYDMYAPSVRMDYDFFAFKNSGDPVWVKTISREKHYQQSAISDTITKVEYSDGFGRLLQTRVQAEDVLFGNQSFGSSGLPVQQGQNANAVGVERAGSDPMNVVVSGWKIYNNKGKVVEQYEPFFDKGFDFSAPPEVTGIGIVQGAGVSVKLFYDPLGRVIRTVNPDSSEQWVLYGIPNALNTPGSLTPSPWESYTYDANDLAPLTNPSGSNVPGSHWYTPKSAELDALGRTVLTREFFDNSDYSNTIDMQYRYDIRGNLLVVKDPYSRVVFEHVYDLRPPQKGEDGQQQPLPPLRTLHIDKGLSTVLFDAGGKPVESHDAKGAQTLSAYDVISRPVFSWAKNKTGGTITLRGKTIYGEGHGVAVDNLKGKVYESYDEAGRITFSQYDFKGNVLSKMREVVKDDVLEAALDVYTNFTMDWDHPPALSLMQFVTDMRYDALNRITELILPTDLDAERKKIRPAYNKAGALEKVDLYSTAGGGTTTNYVENIAYNAKGQRLLIAFGNNRMTRYVYDPFTFRLLRQRTEGYTKSLTGNTITYAYNAGTNKQDDKFNYDLIGNIINIFTRVTDCGIGGNPDELDRIFEYDPLYRLIYADGRESDTQNGNAYLYNDVPIPSTPLPSNVNYYERNYVYDKLGNIESIVQTGTNGFTRDFTYNTGRNTLQKTEDATPAVIENYTYDDCGNTLNTNLNRHYLWNHANQLICYKNQVGMSDPTVFTQYDYAGQDRVSKTVRTGNNYERTIYIDGIFEYIKLETISDTYEKNYIHMMDDKSRIAEIRVGDVFPDDIGDDITFNLENQIGSSVVRLNTGGTVIDNEEYYPFGDSSLRTFTYKRYRYVGKEKDSESGLYYYGARYYAAWTCRFISVDPLAPDYPHLTPYNYAGNKPIGDFDIDGMQGTGEEKGGNNNNNNNQSVQDNTAVSNKSAELAAKNNIGDYKPGVKFKLTVDNRIDGASDEYNKKSYNEINVDNTDAYKKVMQDDYFGPILREMVSSGLIQNGTDVNFKLTGNETSINTSGESLAFKYNLSWTNGNEKMTVPITISAGEIVRFSGSHPIDYPLALIGSGAYSQLFKSAIVANAERVLLQATKTEMTTVGRWMSKAEYDIMAKTGKVVEGAGGKTSVATGGSDAFKGASKGSVYAEFDVPTNSLIQGGQSNWYSLIGPNANNVMKSALQKQGGAMLPEVKNLSPILRVK